MTPPPALAERAAIVAESAEVWRPKRGSGGWRLFLTDEERRIVQDAERQSQAAKQRLAEATVILNPIRQRAAQRALYARRKVSDDRS